jgi:16S rRNA processing protein RimM
VRVEVLTDRPADRFVVGARLFPEGGSDALTIVEARPADPGWVLRFGEVPTREAAEALRQVYLEVEAGPADALPRGAYYWHEMVGVTVRDLDGRELGTVREVYRAGGGDVLEVVGGPRGDFDLPLSRPFVRILAPRRGEIVVDPEPLDLPTPEQVRAPRPPRPPRPRRATRRRPASPAQPAVPPADGAAPDDAAPDDAAGAAPPGETPDPAPSG